MGPDLIRGGHHWWGPGDWDADDDATWREAADRAGDLLPAVLRLPARTTPALGGPVIGAHGALWARSATGDHDAARQRRDGQLPAQCWCGRSEVLIPPSWPDRGLTGACDRRGCALLGGDEFLAAFHEALTDEDLTDHRRAA